MFLTERLELDLANRGYWLVGWIGAVLNVLARYIPEYPPPIPMVQKKQKGRMAMKQAKPAEPPSWFARRHLWSVKIGLDRLRRQDHRARG